MSRVQCLCCFYYTHSRQCLAFPQGIPEEIYSTDAEHNEPILGDSGITFMWRDGDLEKENLENQRYVKVHHKIGVGVLEHSSTIEKATLRVKSIAVLELPDMFIRKPKTK
jgi:hypothetical protein